MNPWCDLAALSGVFPEKLTDELEPTSVTFQRRTVWAGETEDREDRYKGREGAGRTEAGRKREKDRETKRQSTDLQ